MKKSVFTLLAIATMVVSMSSCSKDDAGSNAVNTSVAQQTQTTQTSQSQAPVEKNYYAAKVALDSTLLSMGTYTLTVQDGDKTQDYVINTAGKSAKIKSGNLTTFDNGTVMSSRMLVLATDGKEFRLGFTSTSKTVKFSLSFKPNENYVLPETEGATLLYNFCFANVASESEINWDCIGNYVTAKTADFLSTAQKIVATGSQTFTK